MSRIVGSSPSRKPRQKVSMFLEEDLWRDVRKAAIDSRQSTGDFVNAALREKLERLQSQ